jgi:uncharacterized protein
MKRRAHRPAHRSPMEPSEPIVPLRTYVKWSLLGSLPVGCVVCLMAFAPWEVSATHTTPPATQTAATAESTTKNEPEPPQALPSPIALTEDPGKDIRPEDLVFGRGSLARDLADWVAPPAVEHLDSLSKVLESRTGIQLGILIVPNLGGQDIEGFALKAARKWGLGQKKKNNGILLLVARNERKVRVEVGRGLEGDLTDLQSHRIIDEVILPLFKRGQVENALTAGVEAIIGAVAPELTIEHRDWSPPSPAPKMPAPSLPREQTATESYPGRALFVFLFAVLFAVTGWKVVVRLQYRWLLALLAALGVAFAISTLLGAGLTLASLVTLGSITGLLRGASTNSDSSSSSWSTSSSSSSGSDSSSSGSSGQGGSFGGGGASDQW